MADDLGYRIVQVLAILSNIVQVLARTCATVLSRFHQHIAEKTVLYSEEIKEYKYKADDTFMGSLLPSKASHT